MTTKPTADELRAAADKLVPDIVGPNLRVLFCGINPGLYSAATGHHFARPGNRFWPALYASGLTPILLKPEEDRRLLEFGYGITNVAMRASTGAAELTPDELRTGWERLVKTVQHYQPQWLAVLGIDAYKKAFGLRQATVGLQDRQIGSTHFWLLPNPSGLNAHYTPSLFAEAFAELRDAAFNLSLL